MLAYWANSIVFFFNDSLIEGEIWLCAWCIAVFIDNFILDPFVLLLVKKFQFVLNIVKFRGFYISELENLHL